LEKGREIRQMAVSELGLASTSQAETGQCEATAFKHHIKDITTDYAVF
jgi:hypothetical protein